MNQEQISFSSTWPEKFKMIIPYQNLELLSDESLEKGFFKKVEFMWIRLWWGRDFVQLTTVT